MHFFAVLRDWFLNSIFPLSREEVELFSFSPEQAWEKLQRAPRTPDESMYSVFAYKDKRVTKLIWNVKYKKSLRAANIGGYALGRYITELFVFSKPVLIIPIPITPKRLRERGYNQCHLLLDKMYSNLFILEKELLVRIHHDSRHTLKNRKERLASAKGLFAVNEKCLGEKYMDKDITVIVIDDVITTGSTIKEAMQTLRDAGFEKVYGVSVAH